MFFSTLKKKFLGVPTQKSCKKLWSKMAWIGLKCNFNITLFFKFFLKIKSVENDPVRTPPQSLEFSTLYFFFDGFPFFQESRQEQFIDRQERVCSDDQDSVWLCVQNTPLLSLALCCSQWTVQHTENLGSLLFHIPDYVHFQYNFQQKQEL